MAVTRIELQEVLAKRDPRQLERVLDASEVWFPDGSDGEELARRLVDALWWRTHSPLGKAMLSLPVDSSLARMVALALPLGCIADAVVIAAVTLTA